MTWLLDPSRPNLHWRALTDLVGRPADSPAVVRARGGADAVNPIAALLEELRPDGSWECDTGLWKRFAGPGWRLLAAVQWGADPSDPRLHEACERLLGEAPGSGGFALDAAEEPKPWLTARVLQTLAGLGWCRHSRFQEAVAWLDEAAPRSDGGGWLLAGENGNFIECEVTPVALLDALTLCSFSNRTKLAVRAVESVRRSLASVKNGEVRLGHPNLERTDPAEALATLARADAAFTAEMRPALSALQQSQDDRARWARTLGIPESLPVSRRPQVGEPSRWITLNAVVAILRYAVDAELPRLFPQKPS